MSDTQLLEKIDAAIAEKSLLKHPFLPGLAGGKLSRESLQLYAAQYYRTWGVSAALARAGDAGG